MKTINEGKSEIRPRNVQYALKMCPISVVRSAVSLLDLSCVLPLQQGAAKPIHRHSFSSVGRCHPPCENSPCGPNFSVNWVCRKFHFTQGGGGSGDMVDCE